MRIQERDKACWKFELVLLVSALNARNLQATLIDTHQQSSSKLSCDILWFFSVKKAAREPLVWWQCQRAHDQINVFCSSGRKKGLSSLILLITALNPNTTGVGAGMVFPRVNIVLSSWESHLSTYETHYSLTHGKKLEIFCTTLLQLRVILRFKLWSCLQLRVWNLSRLSLERLEISLSHLITVWS